MAIHRFAGQSRRHDDTANAICAVSNNTGRDMRTKQFNVTVPKRQHHTFVTFSQICEEHGFIRSEMVLSLISDFNSRELGTPIDTRADSVPEFLK